MANMNGSTYLQLIEAQKLEKYQTAEQIRKLRLGLDEAQRNAYQALLKLNAEIANKCFKEISHDMPFSSRISSATTLMDNEIRRLEQGMEMPESFNDELDSALDDLKNRITEWEVLRKNIRQPVKESEVFRKAIDAIERDGRDDFPIVENLMTLQETENKFLEDAAKLADSVQAIVQKREAEMDRHIRQVDSAMRQNIAQIASGLELKAAELKEELKQEQQHYRQELDKMYDALLEKFVHSCEQSCLKMNAAYHKLDRRRAPETDAPAAPTGAAPESKRPQSPPPLPRTGRAALPPPPPPPPGTLLASRFPPPPPPPGAGSGASVRGTTHSAPPPPPPAPAPATATTALGQAAASSPMWKSVLDSIFQTALKEDRQRRALEEQMDQLLIAELDASKIEVQDHGMSDEYLSTLMDKLTALYLEASEIDLKRARTQPPHAQASPWPESPARKAGSGSAPFQFHQ